MGVTRYTARMQEDVFLTVVKEKRNDALDDIQGEGVVVRQFSCVAMCAWCCSTVLYSFNNIFHSFHTYSMKKLKHSGTYWTTPEEKVCV